MKNPPPKELTEEIDVAINALKELPAYWKDGVPHTHRPAAEKLFRESLTQLASKAEARGEKQQQEYCEQGHKKEEYELGAAQMKEKVLAYLNETIRTYNTSKTQDYKELVEDVLTAITNLT